MDDRSFFGLFLLVALINLVIFGSITWAILHFVLKYW